MVNVANRNAIYSIKSQLNPNATRAFCIAIQGQINALFFVSGAPLRNGKMCGVKHFVVLYTRHARSHYSPARANLYRLQNGGKEFLMLFECAQINVCTKNHSNNKKKKTTTIDCGHVNKIDITLIQTSQTLMLSLFQIHRTIGRHMRYTIF